MNKDIKYSSVFKFFYVFLVRGAVWTIRHMLSDNNDQLSDISGGGGRRQKRGQNLCSEKSFARIVLVLQRGQFN